MTHEQELLPSGARIIQSPLDCVDLEEDRPYKIISKNSECKKITTLQCSYIFCNFVPDFRSR